MKRTIEHYVNRIDKLKSNGEIINVNLIKKAERYLRRLQNQ